MIYAIKQFKFICAGDQLFCVQVFMVDFVHLRPLFSLVVSISVFLEIELENWCSLAFLPTVSFRRFNRHNMNIMSIDSIAYVEYEMDDYNDGSLLFLFVCSDNSRVVQVFIWIPFCNVSFYFENSPGVRRERGAWDERESLNAWVIQLPQEFESDRFSHANTFIYSWKDSVYHNWNGHGRQIYIFSLDVLDRPHVLNRAFVIRSFVRSFVVTHTESRATNSMRASNVCSSKWSSMRWVN